MGVAVTREDIIQQFTFMMKESDGYIDMLDWNNLLDKNKKIADIFTRRGKAMNTYISCCLVETVNEEVLK